MPSGAYKCFTMGYFAWNLKSIMMRDMKLNYKLVTLDVKKGQILAVDPDDGSARFLINGGINSPDGVVYSPAERKIYWTNMWKNFHKKDGSIEYSRLDGSECGFAVKPGDTFTPKQLAMDARTGFLYWCDREGMKIERISIRSHHAKNNPVEVLLDTENMFSGEPEENRHCVGIALDIDNNRIFWTMKGPPKGNTGRILCAPFNFLDEAPVIHPADIHVIYDGLPEPIDLEIDDRNNFLYWSDRGAEPDGNTLNRFSLPGLDGREIVARGFREAIGFTIDAERAIAFVADLSGSIYKIDLATQQKKILFTTDEGALTGLIRIPDKEWMF